MFGSMNWRIFDDLLHSTVVVVGNILFIVLAAYLFSYAISYAGIGELITSWVISLKLNQIEFFIAVFILYTILGCLVESVGMIVITVPLLFPLLPQFGIDPVWFGIILVVFVELGQISPPIGINLYVVQAMWNGKLSDVVMGTIPFHIIMLVLLFMLVMWPEIALWLPVADDQLSRATRDERLPRIPENLRRHHAVDQHLRSAGIRLDAAAGRDQSGRAHAGLGREGAIRCGLRAGRERSADEHRSARSIRSSPAGPIILSSASRRSPSGAAARRRPTR